MSKRHFFLYDFLLPVAIILGIGKLLARQFDGALFSRLDGIKAFGFGMMFSGSALRETLLGYSWLVFAAVPGLLWLIWVRINIEYDYVTRSRRLDRPLYGFVKSLMRWIDGDDGGRSMMQSLEFRSVQIEDRARKAEAELARARKEIVTLEQAKLDLEEELQDAYHAQEPSADDLGIDVKST